MTNTTAEPTVRSALAPAPSKSPPTPFSFVILVRQSIVLVYTDGSVLITHGGTEMGQGLNQKVIQIAAQCLGISVELIRVSECASDRIQNTSPTAASMGSDLNGMATLNACEQLMARLAPVRAANPSLAGNWPLLCTTAYKQQISLGALGFYASPFGGTYRWRTHDQVADLSASAANEHRGEIFNYFAYGASLRRFCQISSSTAHSLGTSCPMMTPGVRWLGAHACM